MLELVATTPSSPFEECAVVRLDIGPSLLLYTHAAMLRNGCCTKPANPSQITGPERRMDVPAVVLPTNANSLLYANRSAVSRRMPWLQRLRGRIIKRLPV